MRKTLQGLPVLLMIFLAPLEVYSITMPGAVHVSLYVALIAALLPLLLLNLRAQYSLPVYLLFIFCLWSLFGVLLAGGHWEGYRGLGVQILYLLTLVYTLTYIRDSRALTAAIFMVIVVGLFSAAMGMTEFISFVFFKKIVLPPFADLLNIEAGGGYGFMNGLMRMHGFFTSSNRLGSFLLLPFGFSLYRSFHGTAHRRTYELISAFFLATILLGLARNAYLGLLVMLSVVSAHWARTFHRRFLLAAVAVGCVGLLFTMPETGFEPLDRANPFLFQQEQEQFSTESTSQSIWTEHFHAALIGSVGTGGIGRGVQNFDEWSYEAGLVTTWGSHSDLIMFLGESGIVGFLCQFLIAVFICRLCWRRYQIERRAGLPPFFLYLLAMYLGLVSTGITRTYYYVNTSFIFIGLIIQAHKFASAAAPTLAEVRVTYGPYRRLLTPGTPAE